MTRWPYVLGLVVAMIRPPMATAQESQSPTAVAALVRALTDRHMEAIAARDTVEPDRFVAALFSPHAPLTVVSARYGAPALLQGRLDRKEYRDAYADLAMASIKASRVFFQDVDAAGLHAGRSDDAVIMVATSAGRETQTIFDGDWHKQGLSKEAYLERFATADALYTRVLSELTTALTAP